MHSTFPPDLNQCLSDVLQREPAIKELWFIGSRANGTQRPDSDWDFLAFGTIAVLESLRSFPELDRRDVDFLVVTDDDHFESAWGKNKTGSLLIWHWSKFQTNKASYLGQKFIPDEQDPDEEAPFHLSSLGRDITKVCAAYKIWPKE
jgi:hypothetical protein